MSQVVSITKPGATVVKTWNTADPTKKEIYVYNDGAQISYNSNRDGTFNIEPPSKSNPVLSIAFADLDNNYGTANAEAFVDYCASNGFFLEASGGNGASTTNVPVSSIGVEIDFNDATKTEKAKTIIALNALPATPLTVGAVAIFVTTRIVLANGEGIELTGQPDYAIVRTLYTLTKPYVNIGSGTVLTEVDVQYFNTIDSRNVAPIEFDLGDIVAADVWDFVTANGPYSTPNSATVIFRAIQNGTEELWLYLGQEEEVGNGFAAVVATDFRLFPVGGAVDPEVPAYTNQLINNGANGVNPFITALDLVPLVLNTIFVDSVSGNDGTGLLENPLLPFATVDAALAAVPDADTGWTIHIVDVATHEINVAIPANNVTIYSPVAATLSFDSTPVTGDLLTLDFGRITYIKFDLPNGTINLRPPTFVRFYSGKADIIVNCNIFNIDGNSEFEGPIGWTFKCNTLNMTGNGSLVKLMPVSIRPVDVDITTLNATGTVYLFESSIHATKGGTIKIDTIIGTVFTLHQEIDGIVNIYLGNITLSNVSLSNFVDYSIGTDFITYYFNNSIVSGKIRLAYYNLKCVGNITIENNDERNFFLYKTFLSFGSLTYNGTGLGIFQVGNNPVNENVEIENYNIVNNNAGTRLLYNFEGATVVDFLGVAVLVTRGYCSYQASVDGQHIMNSNQVAVTNMGFHIYGDFSTNSYIQNQNNDLSITVTRFLSTAGSVKVLDTGTVIALNNSAGNICNMASANTATSYTTLSPTLSGYSRILINAASEPVITGATKITGSAFAASTDMYMTVWYNGVTVEFWFEVI